LNFLRSKQGRQAIYSGKRTGRTNIPSLQDLCVETLKDNVDGKKNIFSKLQKIHRYSL
jgi:hypothetical protein